MVRAGRTWGSACLPAPQSHVILLCWNSLLSCLLFFPSANLQYLGPLSYSYKSLLTIWSLREAILFVYNLPKVVTERKQTLCWGQEQGLIVAAGE